MLALFLDYRLSAAEQVEVEIAVGEPIELVRIPWLLPTSRAHVDPNQVLPHLRRLHIDRESGRRTLLVVPADPRWYASLAQGIWQLTRVFPLLVQPSLRRDQAGCPGPLRILDAEAYFLDEDATTTPPWIDPGLVPPDLAE